LNHEKPFHPDLTNVVDYENPAKLAINDPQSFRLQQITEVKQFLEE
jgi:hypothetical protein